MKKINWENLNFFFHHNHILLNNDHSRLVYVDRLKKIFLKVNRVVYILAINYQLLIFDLELIYLTKHFVTLK